MPNITAAIDRLRQQINSRSKNKILILASTIADYQRSDCWEQIYAEFLHQQLLSLGYTTMLLAIAANPTLISLEFADQLPNSFKILHQLSFLNQTQLKSAIEAGIVEKTMSLTTAKKLRHQLTGA